jgi:hypothetical protein
MSVLLEGYLWRESSDQWRNWQRRYFVLTSTSLVAFANVEAAHVSPDKGVNVVWGPDAALRVTANALKPGMAGFELIEQHSGRTVCFCAESTESRSAWMDTWNRVLTVAAHPDPSRVAPHQPDSVAKLHQYDRGWFYFAHVKARMRLFMFAWLSFRDKCECVRCVCV